MWIQAISLPTLLRKFSLSVPKSEIQKRIEEHKKQAALNPTSADQNPNNEADTNMKMWEYGYAWGRNGHVYKDIADQSIALTVKEYITQLGRDGWEFCGTTPERDGHVLIFKRPTHD